MSAIHRPIAAVPAAALAALALAAIAPAADAPAPRPVVRLGAIVRPGRLPIPNGTPMTLTIDTRFASVPAGGDFVLQEVAYLFGRGARFNAALFPSCSVAKLDAARGRLGVCPPGSRIGGGYAVGTAVAVGVSSRARITLFNGPRGRSVTMNASVVNPVLINKTAALPIVRTHGRYVFKLSSRLPQEFRSVLDGAIVVSRLRVTAGATRTIGGVRRGYFEALNCPRAGSPIHGEFVFEQGVRTTADTSVPC